MVERGNLIQITPFFGVSKLDAALPFYRDILGFGVFVLGGGYAYIERDRIAIRLLELDAGAPFPPGRSHCYVDVHDVEAMFAEVEASVKQLENTRWSAPKDQPHGQREFWVRDPDGNLIHFGQGIGENAGQWDYRQ